jgi:hypothetical protein
MHRSSVQHVLILVSLCGCATRAVTDGDVSTGNPTTGAGAGASAPDQAGASAGNAANTGAAGTGTTNGATSNGMSFETSVQPFINMACNCHQSNPLMAPFSLKKGEAYQAIVNVPSAQVTTMMLVKPGSTQESYLWHKVNGTFLDVGGSGMIMPFTIPLNATEKKIFEQWILDGAKP